MNYVVPSRTLRNLKSISVGTNTFYDLVRSQPFSSQSLIVPGFYLEVSFVNQNPIANVKVSGFSNMKVALFMVDTFKYIVDVVVHYSYSVEPFFCWGGGEFVVVVEVYGV